MNTARDHFILGDEFVLRRLFRKAVEEYSNAIALDPQWAVPYLSRGKVFESIGEFQLAIEDYNLTIYLDHSWAEAYESRARIYSMSNMDSEAWEDINRAVEVSQYDVEQAFARGNNAVLEQDRLNYYMSIIGKRYDRNRGWV